MEVGYNRSANPFDGGTNDFPSLDNFNNNNNSYGSNNNGPSNPFGNNNGPSNPFGNNSDPSNPLVNIDTAQALSIDTADFSIRYNKYALGKDYAGSDCLLYYFTYTNRSSEPSSPMKDIRLKAFQNGKSLSDAIPNGKDAALDNFYAQVNPQETITVCRAFSLADRSNVTMQADVSGNDGPTVSTHMLKLE